MSIIKYSQLSDRRGGRNDCAGTQGPELLREAGLGQYGIHNITLVLRTSLYLSASGLALK